MNTTVFCDADGVLTDFDQHVMSFSGGIHPSKMEDADMWKMVDAIPDFWITMPFFPWAYDLIDFIRPYNLTILTGCPKTNFDEAAAHKKEKFTKYFPELPVITCLSKDKGLHINAPGDILLDDRHSNIKRWAKAGGRPILFRTYEQALADLTIALKG